MSQQHPSAAAAAAATTVLAVNNLTNTKMNNHHSSTQVLHGSTQHGIPSAGGNNLINGGAGNGATGLQSSASSTSTRDDSTIVGLHYRIGKKIGEGSFGVLFEGINMINNVPVAIKFEPRKTDAPQLKDEYRTYKILNGSEGIPQAYYFGQEGLHNILVIDLLGPSLEDLFDWCGRRFSIKTVVQVAIQMITLIEELHDHDLIYRDIKPDNFLIGRPNQPDANMVHLIDFGMAKLYRDPKTKQHIPYREKKSLSGTARYMSINTHLGREQSRRDDMEALGHVFFYFLRGQLPWQGLKAANNKLKYEKIGEKKRSTNVYDLSQGLPVQFGRYLEIVRNLAFEETPDYEGYRKLLLSVLDELGQKCDGDYDWMKLNGGRGWDIAINKKPNLHGYGHPTPPNDKSKRHRNKFNQVPAAVNNMNGSNVPLQSQSPLPGGTDLTQGANNAPQQPQQSMTQQQYQQHTQQRLDPTSYEAYKQQVQQRYAQQPQSSQQKAQRLPNTTSQQQFSQSRQQQPQYQFQQNQPQNNQNQATSSGSEKGFFSKLGCC